MAAPAWLFETNPGKSGSYTPPGATHPGFGPVPLTYTDENGTERWISSNEVARDSAGNYINKPNFGGGAIGGPGSGGGPTSGYSAFGSGAAGSPGTIASPGLTGAATGATGGGIGLGAGAGGGAMAGGSWWSNPELWGAVLGAGSSYLEADAANKPRNTTTDQASSQLPYAPSIEHLNRILAEQARLYERGGRRGGGGLGGGGGPEGIGEYGTDAAEIYRQIAERGLGAGDTEGMRLGMGQIADMLGGGETGFEGHNPILADLTGRLGGANLEDPMGLLAAFLGENDRNRTAGVGAGGGPGGGGSTGGRWSAFAPGGGGSWGAGGGMVPDTGRGGGTFQRELDRIFSEEANEEEIAAVLDSMRGDLERSKFSSMADLEARAAGSGRFGGDSHRADIATANARFAEELGQISAQLRYGDLEQRRNARLAALNLLNNRDIAAMSDKTARAGIGASAASSRYATDVGKELGLRGQDLEAIMGIMQGNQFGLSTLMGLGERLSGDQTNALALIPQFEGLGLAGLETAGSAAGGLTNIEGMDIGVKTGAANRRNAAAERRRNEPQQRLNDYLRTVGAIGSMGGTSTTRGTNVVPGAGVNPWGAAAQGGLGGWLTGWGLNNPEGARR